jgi:hypothetical protein
VYDIITNVKSNNKKSNIKKESADVPSKEQGLNTPSQSADSFSVLDKLPSYIYFEREEMDFKAVSTVAFLEITKSGFEDVVWKVAYITMDDKPIRQSVTFVSPWLVGSATKMLVWLMEHNKLK